MQHKFRGWHTTKKIMISCEQLVEDQLTLLADGRFINVSGRATAESIIYPRDKFIPLQYIGINDKHAVEICEGDIVKWNGRFITPVTFNGGVFYGHNGIPACRWHGREIIGNIYESPELLK